MGVAVTCSMASTCFIFPPIHKQTTMHRRNRSTSLKTNLPLPLRRAVTDVAHASATYLYTCNPYGATIPYTIGSSTIISAPSAEAAPGPPYIRRLGCEERLHQPASGSQKLLIELLSTVNWIWKRVHQSNGSTGERKYLREVCSISKDICCALKTQRGKQQKQLHCFSLRR